MTARRSLTFRHKEGFFFTARLGLHTEMRDSDQAASAAITLRDSIAMDSLLTLAEQAPVSACGNWISPATRSAGPKAFTGYWNYSPAPG